MDTRDLLKPDMIRYDFFGERARFHHLGMAVRSIEEVSPQSAPIFDPVQKVRVAFVMLNGIQVELIEAQGDSSPILQSLEKGMKLLHMCYTVPELEPVLRSCRTHGFHSIKRPVPAVVFDNKRIAWVCSKDYGLFELLEDPGASQDEGNE